MKKAKQPTPQVDESGKLYQVPSSQTDIRRTFREKFNWIGPEERRNRDQEKGNAYDGE